MRGWMRRENHHSEGIQREREREKDLFFPWGNWVEFQGFGKRDMIVEAKGIAHLFNSIIAMLINYVIVVASLWK